MQTPDLKTYSNYRDFLNAYASEKRKKKVWSLGVWSQQLKLKSSSTLTMVLNGQRHPGKKLTQAFAEHFNFTRTEQKYFETLVNIQKNIKDPKLSLLLLKSPELLMDSDSESHTKVTSVNDLFFLRMTHVLREMALLQDFKSDAEWISKRLLQKVTPSQIGRLIEQLLEAKIVTKSSQGRIIPESVKAKTNADSKLAISGVQMSPLALQTAKMHIIYTPCQLP